MEAVQGNSTDNPQALESLLDAAQKPRKRYLWRFIRKAAGAFLLLLTVLVVAFWGAVGWFPYPAERARLPQASTWLEDRTGRPLAAWVGPNEQWFFPLTAEEISPHLRQAIVAVEDKRFYSHHGVDGSAIAAAAWQDLTALHIVRGASTLTMQLERLRDPQPRSLSAKFMQAFRACQIERRQTKSEILTEYLNRAPFGGNLMGAGAASWRYFGKPCRELSLGQAALLAGLPQNPNRFRPDRFPERAAQRREWVLRRMLDAGFITAAAYQTARQEPLDAVWRALPQEHPPGAEGALPSLLTLADRVGPGAWRTTLDAAIQHQTYRTLNAQWERLRPAGVTGACAVVLETAGGEIRAVVSLSEDASCVDLSRAARSTGSTLKPFLYAMAFEEGWLSPEGLVEDAPTNWAGYAPTNADHTFAGVMTAGEALAESRNIPAMAILAKVGVERALGGLEALGMTNVRQPTDQLGLSLAIGGAEVTPLELAAAYATFGRGGIYRKPSWQIPAANGRRVLPEWVCWQTLGAIATPDRTTGCVPEAAATHVAWKTGTSNGYRDAWCAAVTRQHTVVVWFGRSQGHGTAGLTGIEAAAPVALTLVAAMEGRNAPWPLPEAPTHAFKRPLVTPSTRLGIASPAASARLYLSDENPTDQQRVALRPTGGTAPYWWFVDDGVVGKEETSGTFWWTPTTGVHEVRVVDGTGHTASVTVEVRDR